MLVLAALLEAPDEEHFGLEIAATSGLKSGSLYPILSRLEDHGWLTSRWEDVDPSAVGRPPRRYYKLTGSGHAFARQELAARATTLRWNPGAAV